MHCISQQSGCEPVLSLLQCLKNVAKKRLFRCLHFKILRPICNVYSQVTGNKKKLFVITFDNIMPRLRSHPWDARLTHVSVPAEVQKRFMCMAKCITCKDLCKLTLQKMHNTRSYFFTIQITPPIFVTSKIPHLIVKSWVI